MTVSRSGPVCVHLVVLAGGQGLRAGGDGAAGAGGEAPGDLPKQFRPTGRGPLFTVSVRSLLGLDPARGFGVASIVVTVPQRWREVAAAALGDLAVPWALAPAGPTRTASTFNALSVLAAGGPVGVPQPQDLVAIHDAARPFATPDLLQRLAETAVRHGGAVPGVPVSDTIVEVGAAGEQEARYLTRAELRAVQTPQVFRWAPCWEAHRWASDQGADFTDDGALLALRGLPPVVVPGDEGNWKVTTQGDWLRAEARLRGTHL